MQIFYAFRLLIIDYRYPQRISASAAILSSLLGVRQMVFHKSGPNPAFDILVIGASAPALSMRPNAKLDQAP